MNKLSFLSKLIVLSLVGISLSACSPVKIPSPTMYQLNPALPTSAPAGLPNGLTLLISAPQAAPGYDLDKIAYVQHPYQLGYFTKNKWVDEPANMLEPLMVTTLQNTHRFNAVTGAPFSGFTDLRVDTTLLKLQQNFLTNPSQVELVVDVRVVRTLSQRIIASKQFNIVVPAPRNTPDGGVQAANQAVALFLQQLTLFILNIQN